MEVTKLSTKGQIVIPEEIRKGISTGTSFAVSRKDNLIILKQIENLSPEEQEEIEEINKIWKEIDSGECESYEAEEFFKRMKEW